jgi:hypothetical protein
VKKPDPHLYEDDYPAKEPKDADQILKQLREGQYIGKASE